MTREPLTVQAIAEIVGGAVEGDGSAVIEDVAAVDTAGAHDVTFADPRHASALADSEAGAAIVGPRKPESAPIPLIRVADVQEAVYKLLTHLAGPEDVPAAGVDPSAVVAPGARLGAEVAIGPNAVVSAGATIGDRSILCANVFVGRNAVIGCDSFLAEGVVVRFDCRLGDRVRIGSNTVIGYDGFGYCTIDGVHRRVPHIGNVVIEDDVEIGACTCVDRAKFGSTWIGAGARIDNLVQIAHNCQIGPGSILAGQVGIAGSVKLGRYVVLGGHAGLRDNITVGDGVQVAAYSGVSEDLPAGGGFAGTPARPAREMFRILQASVRLPELLKRVKKLESRLGDGESPEDH